jgi:hypothetical protein
MRFIIRLWEWIRLKIFLSEFYRNDMNYLRKVRKMVLCYNDPGVSPYAYETVYTRLFRRRFLIVEYLTDKPKKPLIRGTISFTYEELLNLGCDGAIFGYETKIYSRSGERII